VQHALGAPGFRGQIVCNLDGYGNTASTTHFLALHRFLVEGRIAPGQRVLLLCFASGMVVGAVIFDVDDELVARFARSH
jgi:3-oxoacyl-[acyl-carrier-protein] synthase-3